MNRSYNFSAGPAALPVEALEAARDELLNFEGSGMSIMEQSHRGANYDRVHHEAIELLTELLAVPETHQVLLLQGGATQQFATVPMNFLPEGGQAAYLVTGAWGEKAFKEAQVVAAGRGARAVLANPGGETGDFTSLPEQVEGLEGAAYLHVTSNETIHGVQYDSLYGSRYPDCGALPLVCDMSSDFLWQPTDLSRFDLVYAGAQKNIGPSGVVVVILRKDWMAAGNSSIPNIFRYSAHGAKNSLLNTPPTFSIYMVRNVLRLLKSGGGLAAAKARNEAKAARLYGVIEAHSDFYHCPVRQQDRSAMNVVWRLPNEALEQRLVEEAGSRGMSGLKGHRSVGGIRASIYNAVPLDWVEALAEFLEDFASKHSG
ncbi:MAG: 3-phosphoserine/phosphohydroxythreonine transaminase [Myxococcales bacterium]|nr:3-phosphoserine/phosphohydroxythreonine transaminase [Myxococcales bacterium]